MHRGKVPSSFSIVESDVCSHSVWTGAVELE